MQPILREMLRLAFILVLYRDFQFYNFRLFLEHTMEWAVCRGDDCLGLNTATWDLRKDVIF